MSGISAGSKKLLDALTDRANTELDLADGVAMTPGAELDLAGTAPVETEVHTAAVKLRGDAAATPIDDENVLVASREVALLAAHERAVQRGTMSRMRMIALYRNRLGSRIQALRYGIPEGLVS